jgi:subtilisin family serine protease
MLPEGENRIIDDNYADILIEYSGDYTVFDRFPNATYNIINFQYAVVHIPNSMLTFDFVAKWGYFIIPRCFGLLSEASIEASGIQRIRNIPNFALRGQGVLIGIIDTGIDYTNPIFQYSDKTTRIVSIWDQNIHTGNPPVNLAYGIEYTREELNLALSSPNPLEVVPSSDEIGHGSMISGIAAGNEVPESNFYGVAPEAELVVVKLKQAKKSLRDFNLIPESAVCYSEADILFGVSYLLQVANAQQKPLVICLALGTSQGGHDGRGILSNSLSLLGTRPGIGIVVAAGNEGNGRRHYFGKVNSATGKDLVELNVGEDENGFIIELWGESPSISLH